MFKRVVPIVVLFVLVVGLVAALTPSPAVAKACVQCPVIEDPVCPPCYELIPQTCTRCARCVRIRGCKVN